MTQKAAVGTVSSKLLGVIFLVESSAFWKTAALIMSSICWTKLSARLLAVCSASVLSERRAHPRNGDDQIVPAEGVLGQAHTRKDSHTKESRRYSGEGPCGSRGLVCASDQSFLVSHCRYVRRAYASNARELFKEEGDSGGGRITRRKG